ncbi:MAG: CpsB/CapC family capsule biosynthesis tyrosine phosphatase [Rikenellaceae bacterium]
MFSFIRRYNFVESKLFNGFADCHSHILPGVDDGVQSVDESLKILEWYEQMGVKRVIFTPHIMEDYPKNDAAYLREEFAKFRGEYSGNIELSLAAEYMLDSKFERHIESGDMLTLWDNYLLVESSYMSPPLHFFETLQMLMSKGYFVVLAHPERYLFLTSNDYKRLKEMGILFQLNLLSICGGYGEVVKKRTQTLLDSAYYDIVGSDIHKLGYHDRMINESKLKKSQIEQIIAIVSKKR